MKSTLARRDFLKQGAQLTLVGVLASRSLAAVLAAKGSTTLVGSPDDAIAASVPAQWALGELQRALEAQGVAVRLAHSISAAAPGGFCIVAGSFVSPLALPILVRHGVTPPDAPESLCLVPTTEAGHPVLLAAGADPLGLVYALTELADRVRCLATDRAALAFTQPVIEQPASRVRSMMRQFCSETEDKVWFYDREFWQHYLDLLVTSRVNRFSFTTGMGYNYAKNVTDGYLLFSYPFLLDVPGYQVRPRGLTDEERARNLATLRFIAEETVRRGLHFQLGLWTVAYNWEDSPAATYVIEGLTDDRHADYCRDAMALLLREIPAISGVTFRVHEESGMPRGSAHFWETQFSAIARCGRRVGIDMHAKNMEPETLEFALATGQPTTISPKYCGEHLSLPYHQSAIRDLEMVAPDKFTDTGTGVLCGNRGFTRYGYADTLAENRNWDVVFRIWPGTQRFLLNGDPATFAGYGRNASFCGAAGIELCESLDFKGRMGSGLPGGRLGYVDASLETHFDFEKYLYPYRLWGRLGYNPDTDPEVWRRALRPEFGPAAPAVEQALAAATRVLPLFTLAHAPSANCMLYWPEIYSNMPVADTSRPQPYGDTRAPKLFGNVSPFDPQLFQSPDECGTALVAGTVTGKFTPLQVAQWLEALAATMTTQIEEARRQCGTAATAPAFRRVEEDVLIARGLALFFAGKLRTAVLWQIFSLTGDRPAAETALAHFRAARDAWATMAERAKSVYRPDITYGSNRSIHGHWLDRIPAFDADIADLSQRMETPPAAPAYSDPTNTARALQAATSRFNRPVVDVQHQPPAAFRAGEPLAVTLKCPLPGALGATLHYRHVDQAERWQSLALTRADVRFQGEIPGTYTARRFALQYYFELVTGPDSATLFPPLATDLANVPYFVVRQAH